MTKMIVGNWKMYKTVQEAASFVQGLLAAHLDKKIYLAVPFTAIAECASLAKETHIVIGAQNMNDAEEGAYTGEIAGIMLKEAGAQFVLLGHSERRKYFKETDAFINKKVLRALQDGLLPILCIGESLEQNASHQTQEVLKTQLENGLKDVQGDFVIAYEPIWAIGTGQHATPSQANETQGFIREFLKNDKIPILYGGSVNPQNVADLTQEPNIDGVLVGGASLSLDSLIKIVQNSA